VIYSLTEAISELMFQMAGLESHLKDLAQKIAINERNM